MAREEEPRGEGSDLEALLAGQGTAQVAQHPPEGEGRPAAATTPGFRRRLPQLRQALVGTALLAAVAAALSLAPRSGHSASGAPRPPWARAEDLAAVQDKSLLMTSIEVAAALAEGLKTTNELVGGAEAMYTFMKNATKKLREKGSKLEGEFESELRLKAELMKTLKEMNNTEKASLKQHIMRELNITSWDALIPREQLHDGNYCLDDEEEFARLCYKRCSLLTDGEYPIRTGAGNCCMKTPCGPWNTQTRMAFSCHGFNVAGDSAGAGRCPHSPGACFKDEELVLNACYKRCSILTYDEFPVRSAPETCCRPGITWWLGYLNPANCITSDTYAVGGGGEEGSAAGDGKVHAPLKALTEEQAGN